MPDNPQDLPNLNPQRILEAHFRQLATRLLVDGDESVVPALVEALKTAQDAQAAEDHRALLDRLMAEEKTVELAQHLGELGENESGLEAFLGRQPTEEEADALQMGTRRRQLEVRAVQLSRLRKAGGGVAGWMEK
ncbi:MAG TPA: hypothetical protein VNL71_12565 [Chloroflexota bacterium]|nr:hypothetical protein [Chloroflexota bacterium]